MQTVGGDNFGSLELQMPDGPPKPFHGYRPSVLHYEESSYPTRAFDSPSLVDYAHANSVALDSTILGREKGVEIRVYLHPFGKVFVDW